MRPTPICLMGVPCSLHLFMYNGTIKHSANTGSSRAAKKQYSSPVPVRDAQQFGARSSSRRAQTEASAEGSAGGRDPRYVRQIQIHNPSLLCSIQWSAHCIYWRTYSCFCLPIKTIFTLNCDKKFTLPSLSQKMKRDPDGWILHSFRQKKIAVH